MEAELLSSIARLQDLAVTLVILMPAVGVGVFVLKGAFGLDRWRL
jgi:hypothetical protein